MRLKNFKNNCLINYGLYQSHYSRDSYLSWDGMLKRTKIDLEPIADFGTRGDIS